MYVLAHKTLGTQIGKTSLANDLLDNQNGGLLNIKLTPSIHQWGATGDAVSSGDPSLTLSFDMGAKMVEAPSPTDPKSVSYIGNGYFGITVNAEFSAYSAGEKYNDVISGAAKPSGHLAIGVGYYVNVLDRSTFDSATFSSPAPNRFETMALGYEFQINGTMSLVGMRSLPNNYSNDNPLGSFTSLSFKYQPAK